MTRLEQKKFIFHEDIELEHFFQAVFYDDLETVEKKLAQGVNVNAVDNRFYTPLDYSVSRGFNIEITKLLIEYGADVNYQGNPETSYCMTPLMLAASRNDIDTIKLLLENDADVNRVDTNGYTALDYAEGKAGLIHDFNDKQVEIVKLLKQAIAEQTQQDNQSNLNKIRKQK